MKPSECETCKKKPFHPDRKCCFNCARAGGTCDVWHYCGEDCCGWEPKKQTIADQIRAKNDDEMRLIDANALLNSDTFTASEGACKECENEYRWAIQEAPTVDAVPVVHGRWVHHYYDSVEPIDDKWYCSECHMCNDHRRTWYCPNCGAKMDGGENNE